MAKLYFYYSTMNAGKTTKLLQSNFNYKERGMNTILYTSAYDNRYGKAKIASRIGILEDANTFNENTNIHDEIKSELFNNSNIHCILVDEAQFLSKQQVEQLCNIVDNFNIPVLTYGLRTDFLGEPFEGSKYLLLWADELIEVKTVCFCGRKATMNAKVVNDVIVRSGKQIDIGGNEKYTSLCRKHYKTGKLR